VDYTQFIFPAYFVTLMFAGAFQHKFSRVVVPAALGLVAVYPSAIMGGFIMLFLIPALLISGFGSE
jgi:hypothetical protein